MNELNVKQAGLSLGILFGLMHLVWVVLVALGFGKNTMDYIHGMHFAQSTYAIASFDILTALTGVVLAVITGFVIGAVFALIYNKSKL